MRGLARAKDVLLGAAGMLLVLLVSVTILWWAVTEPVEDREARPSAPVDTGRLWGLEPPDDLAEDEVWFAELSQDAWTLVAAGSQLRDVTAVGEDVVTSPDPVAAR